MFDTTIHKTTVTPVTRVIEKSITPDKVTEVYKDVRTEVEESILRTFTIESSLLNGVVIETENRYNTSTRLLHIRFVLNGREFIHKTEVKIELTEAKIYNHFADFFSHEVTKILLNETARIVRVYPKK